ncbi:MAG: methylglyoxal synthase [bacterium]|jgi:methylglyoxal synthase
MQHKDTPFIKKTIALVAHDHRKNDLVEWVAYNYRHLINHQLVCTGTTGTLVEKTIQAALKNEESLAFDIKKLNSGPLGGDQQLGAMITEGKIDIAIFLWDPMQPQPHEVDVKALLRILVLYNVPTACNRSTADYLITSSLYAKDYKPIQKDYSGYINRVIQDLDEGL